MLGVLSSYLLATWFLRLFTVIELLHKCVLSANFVENSSIAAGNRLDLAEVGIALCSSNAMSGDVVASITQIRRVWKSSVEIAVFHCAEISGKNEAMIAASASGVRVLDLCDTNKMIPGMNTANTAAKKRLRGFFCKPAALLMSPFNKTMIVDLDVIWLKKPDLLFESEQFLRTGSLFFRDRTYFSRKKRIGGGGSGAIVNSKRHQDIGATFDVFLAHEMMLAGRISGLRDGVNSSFIGSHASLLSPEYGSKMVETGNHSLFWRHVFARSSEPSLMDYQDSSVVLLDLQRHPGMLKVLEKWLPTFKTGWGDKEIYWLAATVAGESFSFEPNLCGSYGDCGVMLHFDPSHGDPFYINGEWIVEKAYVIGRDLEEKLPKTRLVNSSTRLIDHASNRRCMCQNYGCVDMPPRISLYVLRVQWERATRRLAGCRDKRYAYRPGLSCCVPILKSAAELISSLFADDVIFHKDECNTLGCPAAVPVFVNSSYDWFSDSFCLPIRFTQPSSQSSSQFHELIIASQTPPKRPKFAANTSVRIVDIHGRPVGKSVYLYTDDGKLHMIHDGDTFEALGLNYANITIITEDEAKTIGFHKGAITLADVKGGQTV